MRAQHLAKFEPRSMEIAALREQVIRLQVALEEQVRQVLLADRQRILESDVVQFLCGAGELDGVGFSEVPAGKPRYWWRSALRAAIRKGSNE